MTNVAESGIINASGTNQTKYYYDSLSQLVREDNSYANKTYTYEYDGNGNITSKKTYAYTTGTLGSVQDTVTYSYGNSDWKDLLTSYDGNLISYDASGNPLNWRNNSGVSWEGRTLSALIADDASIIEYKYDYNGYRVQLIQTYDDVIVRQSDFTWADGKLVSEYRTGSGISTDASLNFYYDGEELIGFNYNGDNYYYGKTNNGEIRFIYDSNGNIVTTYHYDAWGTPLTPIGTLADTVGAVNPFRYKSYYYDSETRLYYLQSRYYDPQVGRFLNADAVEYLGATRTLLSFNLFAYCENNSVNNSDLYGNFVLEATLIYELLFTSVMIIGFLFVVLPKIQRLWNSLINTLCETNRIIAKEIKSLSVTIYNAMIKSRTYNKNEGTHRHHIVPKKAFLCSKAIKLMEKVGIDRNSSYNIVVVRASLHVYLHTNSYKIGVSAMIESAYARGKSTLEKRLNIKNALEVIENMILVANGPAI